MVGRTFSAFYWCVHIIHNRSINSKVETVAHNMWWRIQKQHVLSLVQLPPSVVTVGLTIQANDIDCEYHLPVFPQPLY